MAAPAEQQIAVGDRVYHIGNGRDGHQGLHPLGTVREVKPGKYRIEWDGTGRGHKQPSVLAHGWYPVARLKYS